MKQKAALTILLLAVAVPTRADQLDDYMKRQMRAQHVTGAVVILMQHSAIIEQRTYGLANIEFNIPMKVEALFPIASITKLFTTTAIFELVQEGKIRLDDHVTSFVPGLPETWKDITILNCLSHTSGLPDLYEGTHIVPIAFTVGDAIQKLALKPLVFNPGEKSQYSQSNFLLLRLAIEKISGKTFEDFMVDHVFRPLKLETAQFADARDVVPDRVTLYSRLIPDASRIEFAERNGADVLSDQQKWVVSFLYPESVKAGAGLMMNARDLAKFDSALSAQTLLSADTLNGMWEPVKLKNGKVGDYTAGWRRWERSGQVIVGHAGGSGVEYIHLINGPQYSIIVLTNCPELNVHQFAMGILGLYTSSSLVAHDGH